jgi:alkanesulfonate monooxygenase SsuD/methylene tetrahydromethanopterin reductase-like flavin-dependent oxidoreductase (luciferase family)
MAPSAAASAWKDEARGLGMDIGACRYPMMVNCIIADTDEEAYDLAKHYIPRFQQAQIDHYEADDGHFDTLQTYTAWAKIFAKMKERTDPANIPPWADGQFVGSPETVRARVSEYIDAGFNSFLIHTATPGVPRNNRHAWLGRFAAEVAPHFSDRFAGGSARVASVA